MVPPHGFEPRLADSKSAVLPLDDGGKLVAAQTFSSPEQSDRLAGSPRQCDRTLLPCMRRYHLTQRRHKQPSDPTVTLATRRLRVRFRTSATDPCASIENEVNQGHGKRWSIRLLSSRIFSTARNGCTSKHDSRRAEHPRANGHRSYQQTSRRNREAGGRAQKPEPIISPASRYRIPHQGVR